MSKKIPVSKSCDDINSPQEAEVYAVEVLKCIAKMKDEELRLCQEIAELDAEGKHLQTAIKSSTDKFAQVMIKTGCKVETLENLKKTRKETEGSYTKIIESSHLLYHSATKSTIKFLGEVRASQDYLNDPKSKQKPLSSKPKDCKLN